MKSYAAVHALHSHRDVHRSLTHQFPRELNVATFVDEFEHITA
jgi:hypothetical protein